MSSRHPRLALPFTILASPDTVRLVAGEDFRYTLSGSGIGEWLPGLLDGFDGRRTLAELTGGLPGERREAALRLVDRLYGERVVVDGPAASAHRGKGYDIRAEGSGAILEGLGPPPQRGESIPVLCQDRLDYQEALRFNRRALAGAVPWLWASYGPMDRGYVSPPFLPGAGPCLHCLFRHFQRLSPAAEIYQALLEHSRNGKPIRPVRFPEEAVEILRRLVCWKVAHLSEETPPAALYRLHVLDVETMEVSSHRVFADPECPDCAKTRA